MPFRLGTGSVVDLWSCGRNRFKQFCAASDFRPAKRPDGASETPLWNRSFRRTNAFGLDEPQNGELLAWRDRGFKHSQNLFGKSQDKSPRMGYAHNVHKKLARRSLTSQALSGIGNPGLP